MSTSGVNVNPRRSWSEAAAVLLGLPLGIALLLLLCGPLGDTGAERYVRHEVERVEVILFACALAALAAKAWAQRLERRAFRADLISPWDGRPVPVGEAARLRNALLVPQRLCNTCVVRRITSVLDFLTHRGSPDGLDDHLRTLSDNDALAQEGSYSFIRLIIWAIPILGFLGTVLGITGAIAGVTPEILEKSMSHVTDGLALAFDATALALALTMILMFVNSFVERIEQATLALVDHYVESRLAHRFQRIGADSGGYVNALQQNTQVLLQATEQLVDRQAVVWMRTIEKADHFWAEAATRLNERFTKALDDLSETLRETTREHRSALNDVAGRLSTHADMLGSLQSGEAQLVRLQETLQQNLHSLAEAGAFERAIESLTAAIHLLTVRAGSSPRLQRPAA